MFKKIILIIAFKLTKKDFSKEYKEIDSIKI